MEARIVSHIGRGLQYEAYLTEDNRVLKKPTTFWTKCFRLMDWGYKNPFKVFWEAVSVTRIAEESVTFIRTHSSTLDLRIFGNPVFDSDELSYIQDRALTIGDYFESHTLEENKKIIDAYISTMVYMWRYGIADSIFNFTCNNAVTNEGKVIVIDLGEFVFSKREAALLIKQRKWLTQHSYTHLNNQILKQYFKDQMSITMTLANLEKNWGIAYMTGE
jgi:hypothetical protein